MDPMVRGLFDRGREWTLTDEGEIVWGARDAERD